MDDLHLVIYTSQLRYADQFDHDQITTLLDELADQSQRNNVNKSLTGVLIFDAGRFVQALEGPDKVVHALVDRIAEDTRHEDMRILVDQPVRRRSFPAWSMRVARVNPDQPSADSSLLEKFRDTYCQVFVPDAQHFLRMMDRLVGNFDAMPR